MTKLPRVPEKRVTEDIKRFYRTMGLTVVSFVQNRATMQTPGIPDLKVYFTGNDRFGEGRTWWFEVKAEGGKQSDHQKLFQRMAEAAGEKYYLGGVNEAVLALEEMGLTKKSPPT